MNFPDFSERLNTRTGKRALFVVLIIVASCASIFAQESARVVKARAFLSRDAVRPGDKFKVAVVLDINEGYHVNAHVPTFDYLIPTTVTFDAGESLKFGELKYPEPEHRRFQFAPETDLAVHSGTMYVTGDVEAAAPQAEGAGAIRTRIRVQSCNDTQCLSPSDISVELPFQTVAADAQTNDANAEIFALAESPALAVFQGTARTDDLGALIASQGIVWALLTVFLAGLALNLTPCVYPIIPITVGFFVNQSSTGGSTRLRSTFPMAFMYVIGMAVTYSLLGVVASLTKGLFGAALQNPAVLLALAGVMVALSLSMFGVYEFKLPEFLNRFAARSAQGASGIIGAFVMGLTTGIVAAPCIGPFVLGLLVHVGATGDPVYGFCLFFVLALGLGLPFLVLGTFSGAIKSLPRSGMWMVSVRKVFGLVLIGMALYFLMPLMGEQAAHVLMGFFAISALYLIFWESSNARPPAFAWILRVIGVSSAAAVVWLALPPVPGIEWTPYTETAVAQARAEGRGVVIDVYADWCVPCKELDHATFTDAAVKQEAERFLRLKLDLTHDDPKTEAGLAKERLNIRGVPTVIFLDAAGLEVSSLRLEGFEEPERFVDRLKKVEFAARDVRAGSSDALAE